MERPVLSTRVREAAGMAFHVMRTHRLRSALVVLGVAIGVTTLMGMVAVLGGIGLQIERDIKSSDEVVVTVSKWDFLTSGDFEKSAGRTDLTPEDADAIAELCPGVALCDFYSDADTVHTVQRGRRRTRLVQIAGGGRYLPLVYRIPIDEGRYFTDADIRRARNVITLGAGPAEVLFPRGGAVGRFVRVGRERFEVVGTFRPRKTLFGELADAFAFVPYTTRKKRFGENPEYDYLYATVAPGWTQAEVEGQIRSVLRMRHRLRAGDPDDFVLTTSDRIQRFVSRITDRIALVLVVLSSIGLTVGGIGVMNIMLVSVTQRTSEIGLRMAVGARARDVLLQVLIEAAVLTGTGGVIGLGLSVLVALAVSGLLGVPFGLGPWHALWAIVATSGIGMIFGLYPAVRAARLDPIEALRQE